MVLVDVVEFLFIQLNIFVFVLDEVVDGVILVDVECLVMKFIGDDIGFMIIGNIV